MDTIIVRGHLFIEQRGLCYICGGRMLRERELGPRLMASIDHVIPKARGGTNHRSNLRLAHRMCNSWKGARLLEELPPLGLSEDAGPKHG